VFWLFLPQSMQFGASLADEGVGELESGPLPLCGQVLHPHVQHRYVFFKPAQGSFYSGDAVGVRNHGNGSSNHTRLPWVFKGASYKVNTPQNQS
jgi:hypothetical protein